VSAKDTLYATGLPHTDFVFDDKVVAVFPDMINRSVPGYATIIAMIGTLAAQYAQPGTRCYDLGCSLGAASLSMRRSIKVADCEIVGVDNSEAMVRSCREAFAKDTGSIPVTVECGDILDTPIENASVVVMNFTLQFIDPKARDGLVKKIFVGLRPGGMLILSEKVRFEDPALNELFIDMHHRFKEQQGYSRLEISRKRAALEKVLVPETLSQHKSRLQEAGFFSYDIWFQCFNFASMVAIKSP
jgi:tRNA (cmo5U34)-methyltransferase